MFDTLKPHINNKLFSRFSRCRTSLNFLEHGGFQRFGKIDQGREILLRAFVRPQFVATQPVSLEVRFLYENVPTNTAFESERLFLVDQQMNIQIGFVFKSPEA
mmetsp:Transcript_21473/g.52610  ORF Transcript_21473/g.52610 Transcript_21473/m.52610 type:complete len:103 (-) Transcript_21473:791-1099(-)